MAYINFEVEDDLKKRFDIILVKKDKKLKEIGQRLVKRFVIQQEKKEAHHDNP